MINLEQNKQQGQVEYLREGDICYAVYTNFPTIQGIIDYFKDLVYENSADIFSEMWIAEDGKKIMFEPLNVEKYIYNIVLTSSNFDNLVFITHVLKKYMENIEHLAKCYLLDDA